MTMRRPPAQKAGIRKVLWRGERNSAWSWTLTYGFGCAAASCSFRSKLSSQREDAGVAGQLGCASAGANMRQPGISAAKTLMFQLNTKHRVNQVAGWEPAAG